ncbi:hypothetical protein TNCV_2471671 [Trichonephila clavipes]|nr:hypothetical protein TNCV_2471671 [Trichonephila clavipes]
MSFSLKMVREDAACVRSATKEAVRSTRTCCMIGRPSRRLDYRGSTEPGRRVNDVSSVQWSGHLLTVKSIRPT